MRNAYMIHETGAGGWSEVKDLCKRKNILEAMTAFNQKASYSISTDESKTDTYSWRGDKYGIHSCYENDGRNGLLVAVVFSDKQLDQQTLVELVESYYFAKGPEWNELFAKLQEDAEFVKALKEIIIHADRISPGDKNECLSDMVGEIESMTPDEMLRPKNFTKVKKLIRKQFTE